METTATPWFKRWQVLAPAGAGVLLLVGLGLAIWFTAEGWWPIVVDIVLAFAALVQVFFVLALVLAVVFLIRTLRELKAELIPVLDSLKSTSNAVQATATTATNFGLKPAIRTASLVVGAGEVASLVFGRGHARTRAAKRQKRRQEIERQIATEEASTPALPSSRELATTGTTGGLDGAR